jgi:hypothetical protein
VPYAEILDGGCHVKDRSGEPQGRQGLPDESIDRLMGKKARL